MRKATMHEAKTNLSALVELAQKGEDVLITSGRDRKPVARVVAVSPHKPSGRTPGMFKGRFKIGRNFDKPLPTNEMPSWMGE